MRMIYFNSINRNNYSKEKLSFKQKFKKHTFQQLFYTVRRFFIYLYPNLQIPQICFRTPPAFCISTETDLLWF